MSGDPSGSGSSARGSAGSSAGRSTGKQAPVVDRPDESGRTAAPPVTPEKPDRRATVDRTSSTQGAARPTRATTPKAPTERGQSAVAAAPSGAAVVTTNALASPPTTRKARLSLTQVDPWSVMKISFVLSIAGGIITIVAVWLLWLLLAGGDVFVSVDRTVGDITGAGSTVSVVEIFSLRRVMGIALMLAVVQVVLITALATLLAFLYNLTAGLVGGLDVTLAEDS